MALNTTASYVSDGHVLLTGPIKGTVTLADGTVYDVSPDVVEIDPAHAGELGHLIGLHYEDNGHPEHDAEVPFVHECSDHCGEAARG
jgi:hypothetical protein